MGDSSPPSNFVTPTARVGTKRVKLVVILEIDGMQVRNLVGQLTILENKHSDLQAEHDQLLKNFMVVVEKEWGRKVSRGGQEAHKT